MAKSKPVVSAVADSVGVTEEVTFIAAPISMKDAGYKIAFYADAKDVVGEHIGSRYSCWLDADFRKTDEYKKELEEVLKGMKQRFNESHKCKDYYGEFAYIDNNLLKVDQLTESQAKQKAERVLVNIWSVIDATPLQVFNNMKAKNPLLWALHGSLRKDWRKKKSEWLANLDGAVRRYLKPESGSKDGPMDFGDRIDLLFCSKEKSGRYDAKIWKANSLYAKCEAAATTRADATADMARLTKAIAAFMNVWRKPTRVVAE